MFAVKYIYFVIKRTGTTVIPLRKQQTERFATVVLSAFRFNTFHCLFNDNCCFYSYDFFYPFLVSTAHKQIVKGSAFNSAVTESVKINVLPRNVAVFILIFFYTFVHLHRILDTFLISSTNRIQLLTRKTQIFSVFFLEST